VTDKSKGVVHWHEQHEQQPKLTSGKIVMVASPSQRSNIFNWY
jgi:hypothetical protein